MFDTSCAFSVVCGAKVDSCCARRLLRDRENSRRCRQERRDKKATIRRVKEHFLISIGILFIFSNCLKSEAFKPSPEASSLLDDGEHWAHNSDITTQIPTDQLDNNDNEPITDIAPTLQSTMPTTTTTSTTTASSTRKSANQANKRILRVTETELLPFADFNVQQPAFSDLMRSWPPTQQQQQQQAATTESPFIQRQRQSAYQSGGMSRNRPDQRSRQALADSSFGGQQLAMRNHLNEDFDDTIVTADESFERDQVEEPPTWINYLGDLADYIYSQLRFYHERPEGSNEQLGVTPSAALPPGQLKLETIDDLLDDYYYDQYENSQVLYYGPQLVREGDIFEIGCYMPNDQPAEWTKSGRLLNNTSDNRTTSPRVIRKTDFLGAKLNYSLKIFEASLSDTGNYRCNRMSRKYHKLVVVPLKVSTTQLYLIQQRLLSVVNPKLMSSEAQTSFGRLGGGLVSNNIANNQQRSSSRAGGFGKQQQRDYLLPGYLIIESQPLLVNCNITDEFVLRKLRENPQFQLTWYKNGKQLRGSQQQQQLLSLNQSVAPARQQQRGRLSAPSSASGRLSAPTSANQRIQFLMPNGRQMYISSAQYSDAGDYLCSWARLPMSRSMQQSGADGGTLGEESQQQQTAPNAINPLSAASQLQLMAPVKLRPFKSSYHVLQGNELRLVCQAQRGFPGAQISWYLGNQLMDADFLREHAHEYKILNLNQNHQLQATSSDSLNSFGSSSGSGASSDNEPASVKQIVEINPIPSSRHQMQLTANGRGSWLEYRDKKNERYAIDTNEQQLQYLQKKLHQLTSSASSQSSPHQQQQQQLDLAMTSISVLVINSLNIERHRSRYACRASNRANTDEVTTVIRVQATPTITVKPSNGKATLIIGQPLYFQCDRFTTKDPNFRWYKRSLGTDEEIEIMPGDDDNVEIHNHALTIVKASMKYAGDYICRVLEDDGSSKDFSIIKLRAPPYIDDFGLQTSHTGRSSIVTDGDKLELTCSVPDDGASVNITWLRSLTPDDEKTMVPIPETSLSSSSSSELYEKTMLTTEPTTSTSIGVYPFAPTFNAPPEQSITIKSLSSHSKKLVIESVRHEHRSYYVCMADNGVTERTRKVIFIRVKDKLIALWPFLGIVAELFILFTIIHVWETQKAYKEVTSSKRPVVSGTGAPFESVPLTSEQSNVK